MEDQTNNMEEPSYPEDDQPFTITDEVSGQEVVFGPGVAGTVTAQENVSISKGGALVISAYFQ